MSALSIALDALDTARKALERIARWHGEFPETGKTWDDGSPMGYAAAYGSNGERDYMREVAQTAHTATAIHSQIGTGALLDAPADLTALRAAAEAATPGPWVTGLHHLDCAIESENGEMRIHDEGGHSKADAKFIAAANPAVVLELLDRLERAHANTSGYTVQRDEAVPVAEVRDGGLSGPAIAALVSWDKLPDGAKLYTAPPAPTAASLRHSETHVSDLEDSLQQIADAVGVERSEGADALIAAVRKMAAQQAGSELPVLLRYSLKSGEQREWLAPDPAGTWCKYDHAIAALAASRQAPHDVGPIPPFIPEGSRNRVSALDFTEQQGVAVDAERRKFHGFEMARMAPDHGASVSSENLGVGSRYTMTSEQLAALVKDAISHIAAPVLAPDSVLDEALQRCGDIAMQYEKAGVLKHAEGARECWRFVNAMKSKATQPSHKSCAAHMKTPIASCQPCEGKGCLYSRHLATQATQPSAAPADEFKAFDKANVCRAICKDGQWQLYPEAKPADGGEAK